MDLYSPITIKGNKIKNRVVMPPMVCFNWSDRSGILSDDHLKHYEERARGGTGLIILEAHAVEKNGRLDSTQCGIWSDIHIDRIKEVADRCHEHGAKTLVQIVHGGFKTDREINQNPVAPSDYEKDGKKARAMTSKEIEELKQNFIEAAVRAYKAGLDGVELHGAHGFLLNQFLSLEYNQRTDQYGGNLEGRLKVATDIIAGIKLELDDDNFIIGYRLGGNTPDLTTGKEAARILVDAGIDLLHVSAGIGEKPEPPADFPENWIVYCGTEIKNVIDIPTIVVNGIRKPEQAEYLIDNKLTDMVAIGRGLLVDPDWASKGKEGIPVNPCLECDKCKWFDNGYKCPGRK